MPATNRKTSLMTAAWPSSDYRPNKTDEKDSEFTC